MASNESNNFYSEQIDNLDKSPKESEIEELKLKRDILRMELELKNGSNNSNQREYQNNIEYSNSSIDFRTRGGHIEKNIKTLDIHKGKIKGLENESRSYSLGHTEIVPSNKGENIYEIHLNSLNNDYSKKIEVEYYGNQEIYLISNGRRYNNISFKNRGRNDILEINYKNETIIINVEFERSNYKNRGNHYERDYHDRNYNNSDRKKNYRYNR